MFWSVRHLALCLLLCWLSACGKQAAQQNSSASAIASWAAGNGKKLSPSLLRLRDASCIDTSRLRQPWHVDDKASLYSNGLGIWASGKNIGIVPIDHDLILGPLSGRLLVSVDGWSPPKKDVIAWEIAPPERIRSNINSGLFSPIRMWRKALYSLEAYRSGGGELAYFDARRLTQCRDYGSSDEIRCIVVSNDQLWSFSIKIAGSNRSRLPEKLGLIEADIEKARGSCPAV